MIILIKSGTIVNDDSIQEADVLIKDEIIVDIREKIEDEREVDRVIDAKGCFVMPGGIDPHTHLQFPFMGHTSVDDFYIGSRAALSGGTTMFIDFVIPAEGESLINAYNKWRSWADPKVCCDYALSAAVTKSDEKTLKEMKTLTDLNYGINSFKFFLAYRNFMLNDGQLLDVMKLCSEIGAVARVHAENGELICRKQEDLLKNGVVGPEGHVLSRPDTYEEEATNRACMIATDANCPLYVVHVMSQKAAQTISRHRKGGAVIFGEPIAAGLGTDGSHYFNTDWRHAAAHVMSPPLNLDSKTPEYLMNMLACGQLHLVGTDNCTFSSAQKEAGRCDFTKIPNGVNGIEDRMSIVWEKGVHSGKIDPMRFVAITSSTAAKIFNIYPKKGRIAVGSDADLIIWDGNATRTISAKTHHHACDFNIFEGMEVHGVCKTTISRGNIVYSDGELEVEKGSGRFIPLPPFSPFCFATFKRKAELKEIKPVDRT